MKYFDTQKAQMSMETARWYAMMLDKILAGGPSFNYHLYIDMLHQALLDVSVYDDRLLEIDP